MAKKEGRRKDDSRAEKAKPAGTERRALEFDVYAPGTLDLAAVDLTVEEMDKKDYEKELKALQDQIYAAQIALFLDGRRAMFAFEGWDAAGKGGAIKRLSAPMDPRSFRVWPIAAPKDEEARQHYLWRFWTRIPEHGEVAIFDRSWYGRVLVERVEGFAKRSEWKRAYDELNAFEKMLTDDGIALVKFWLHIDRKTQLQRFEDREQDPVKHYKIGPDDWRNRKKWKDYGEAVQEMLDRTHRPDAPWHVIPSVDKWHARLEVLRVCLAALKQRG